MKSALAAIALLAFFAFSGEPRAADADLQIVLAADVSRSIDDAEFDLQRKGYAGALTDPRVLSAIQNRTNGAVGVCFVEWSGEDEQHVSHLHPHHEIEHLGHQKAPGDNRDEEKPDRDRENPHHTDRRNPGT